MTFIQYGQNHKAKESKIDDFYSLSAIFAVSLQEKYLYGTNGKERKNSNSFADWRSA